MRVRAYFFPGIMRITGGALPHPQLAALPGMRYPNRVNPLLRTLEQNSSVAQKS
jgi:hypothetical protein